MRRRPPPPHPPSVPAARGAPVRARLAPLASGRGHAPPPPPSTSALIDCGGCCSFERACHDVGVQCLCRLSAGRGSLLSFLPVCISCTGTASFPPKGAYIYPPPPSPRVSSTLISGDLTYIYLAHGRNLSESPHAIAAVTAHAGSDRGYPSLCRERTTTTSNSAALRRAAGSSVSSLLLD